MEYLMWQSTPVDHDEYLVWQELTNWTKKQLQTVKKSHKVTWDSMISIETRHGQDSLGLKSWQGSGIFLFSKTTITTLQPSQFPIQWLQGFFPRGKTAGGIQLTTHHHLVPSLRSGVIPVSPMCLHDVEAVNFTVITLKRPHNERENLKFDQQWNF